MSNVPMPQMPGMLGPQQQSHPAFDVLRKFLQGSATREEAVNSFCDYVMTGMRGIPVPNLELAKSVILSESSQNFMGYPQIIQCMAIVLKTT